MQDVGHVLLCTLTSLSIPIEMVQVHQIFLEIASTQGNKSMDKKKALINKLLVAASSSEAGYIMRALQVGPIPLSHTVHASCCLVPPTYSHSDH